MLLTLKFAGAKKCIQFIALDRITNKRTEQIECAPSHKTACDQHNGEQE